MKGFLSLVLHAHLPFVRHPEHERFLEENWLFEAITETYIPLLQVFEKWQTDGLHPRLSLTLTPPLCSMLRDSLLQQRYRRHLDELIGLAEQEIHRTHWQKSFNDLAVFYRERLGAIRDYYQSRDGDLISAFRKLQEGGIIEIITCAATHALLPLLANDRPSLRAQILIGRDHYQECFGREPRGIWLPECAYAEGLDAVLQEAGLRWFITDTHGILHARPKPRYAMFAPILTPNGIAAFGRDMESAKQVWSRDEGYPGDYRYRDFYRDIGFDLDLDYLRPYLPAPDKRGFTGIKYYKITGSSGSKEVYERATAIQSANEHANHFLKCRVEQTEKLCRILDRPPIVVCPYDAELFGHWWYEGIEFLDLFVCKACCDQTVVSLVTPGDYLERQPLNQVATPAASTWGEGGHMRVWLNEKNQWIYLHLVQAQDKMTELVQKFPRPDPLQERALKQAGCELLLAQSSDWAFILRTGTSPDYARKRVEEHVGRFNRIYGWLLGGRGSPAELETPNSKLQTPEKIQTPISKNKISSLPGPARTLSSGKAVEETEEGSRRSDAGSAEFLAGLEDMERRDNLFPNLNFRYWLAGSASVPPASS